jgi:hypothetical protein
VASIALAAGVQEGAIAQALNKPSAEAIQYLDNEIVKVGRYSRNARLKEGAELQSLRNYRKAWAKQEPQMAPFLGEWTDAIEGYFGIYPSSAAGEVCIIAPFSGHVTKGKISGGVLYYNGQTGVNGKNGKNILYDLGRENVIGVRFVENNDKQLIPFFARRPVEPNSQRAQIFEQAGCRIAPPQTQIVDSRSISGEDLAIQKFRQQIQKFENNPQNSRYIQDRRSAEIKSEYSSFAKAWGKFDAVASDFLGGWGGWEDTIWMYPTNEKGKICVITTEIEHVSFAVGHLDGGM